MCTACRVQIKNQQSSSPSSSQTRRVWKLRYGRLNRVSGGYNTAVASYDCFFKQTTWETDEKLSISGETKKSHSYSLLLYPFTYIFSYWSICICHRGVGKSKQSKYLLSKEVVCLKNMPSRSKWQKRQRIKQNKTKIAVMNEARQTSKLPWDLFSKFNKTRFKQ